MSTLASLWVTALGAALVHFLWEGALVACLLVAIQPLLWRTSAAVRYAVNCLALFSLPVLFVATVARLAAAGGDGLGWLAAFSGAGLHHNLETLLPYVVGIWIAGMGALAARALAGWMTAQGSRRSADREVPPAWRQKVEELCRRMDVRAAVQLGLSRMVPGPCVVGGWKPLILMPLAAVTALPPEQLEAVLAHELAHIRRHDYWVNLLQRGVEVALFYHPAVWWISREVSEAREECCDELAVAACGDRLGYARALVEWEAWRAQWMVAAGGGSLTGRVRRVLGLRHAVRGRSLVAATAATGSGVLALVLAGVMAAGAPAATLPPMPAAPRPIAEAQMISLTPPQERAAQDEAALRPKPLRQAKPQSSAIAALTPKDQEHLVVTFELAEFQSCATQPVLVPQISPTGVVWISVGEVTRCVPVIKPVEVWVETT